MKRYGPVLLLFFLSPVLGELISGSAPPVEFFRPFPLLVLASLYGSGAILVREITVRWGKGWPTIFTLGLAYGLLEEGLMVKSFFDPEWMDLGVLGTYGRWAGVNWVWSLDLMIFHSVISIAVPIFLAEYIFRARRREPWLGQIGMAVFCLLLLAVTLLGYFALTTYRPPAVLYTLAILVTLGLILLAKRMPVTWFTIRTGAAKNPRWFGILGFAAVAVFYLYLLFSLPSMGIPVLTTILLTLAWMGIVFWIVRQISGGGAWLEKHQLALVNGVLVFFALLAPIQEADAARTDDPTGMTWVGIALLVFVIRLQRRSIRMKSINEGEFAESI